MDQPLKIVLDKPDLARRMTGWLVELTQFHIEYEPRRAIKSQALANFVTEMTPAAEEPQRAPSTWLVLVDGSSGRNGSGAGVTITTPEGIVINQALQLNFKSINNQAEYEALIASLLLALELGAKEIKVNSDSQLVVGQLNGTFEAKELTIVKYMEKAK